jgi:hypothetical protein
MLLIENNETKDVFFVLATIRGHAIITKFSVSHYFVGDNKSITWSYL